MSILSLWRHYRVALRTFAAGILLTIALQAGLNIQQKNNAQSQIEQLAGVYAERIEFKLEAETNILRGLQNAFIANPNLSGQTFTNILKLQNIQGRFPDFVSVHFIREIPTADSDSFIALRRQENPNFTIISSSPRPVYQVIDYIFPDTPQTRGLIGMDISDQTGNLIALEYSRDQGRGVASPPFRLKEYKPAPLGFIMRLPVYSPDKPVANPTERRIAFIGSIGASFTIENIISWLGHDLTNNIHIQLQDIGATSGLYEKQQNQQLYPEKSYTPAFNELKASTLIQFPGRQWRLTLYAMPSVFPQPYLFNYLLWILGFSLSLMFALLLQRQRNSHESALDLAGLITYDLRKHEQHFQQMAQLAEESRDLIISRDMQGKISYANRAARLYFSESTPVLLGKNKPLFLSAELAISETPIRQECQHRHQDGELHYFELTLFPLYDQSGKHAGSAMFVHDITQHKELFIELQNSRERFATLVELATDWYWEKDKDFRFTQISAGFFKLHNIDRALLIGRCSWEVCDNTLSAEEWRIHKAQLEAHQCFHNFVYTLQVDFHSIIIRSSGQPYFDDQGELLGYRGIGHDITASINNEQSNQQEQQRIAAILSSMADGVITLGLNGEVEFMNPAAIHLLNCRTTAALGKHIDRIYRVISMEERSPLASLFYIALTAIENAPLPREVLLLNANSHAFAVQESIIHLKNSRGTLTGLALIFRPLNPK